MFKFSDKTGKFLSNYSNVFWRPFFIVHFLLCIFNSSNFIFYDIIVSVVERKERSVYRTILPKNGKLSLICLCLVDANNNIHTVQGAAPNDQTPKCVNLVTTACFSMYFNL